MGTGGGRRRTALVALRQRVERHASLLWWLHSFYVLALGTGIMWLGSRNIAWLRFAAFYLLFIWLSSVFLVEVVNRREGVWWSRARIAVNYVNKNFYQQLLFFILPIYAASTTVWSGNLIFVVVLAVSAVLSTLDLVYDRFLSVHRTWAASFFAFNVFAVVNVALPLLLGISNRQALMLSTVAAVVGFATIAWRLSHLRRTATWLGIAGGAVLVLLISESIRPYVPPAPLRLLATEFGTGLDLGVFRVTGALTSLPRAFSGRVFASTALRAPLGLKDQVELRWYRGSRLLWTSTPHDILGGRVQGFRLWTSIPVAPSGSDALRLDALTAAGQLVGRATLGVRP
ncbi:MAG: DUF5924 family protein [Acidobacteria bacterium]|nr:DUF5924 family protein [Acidobacteriota bacterium]